ncbi:hypothetical protein [Adhaeribacter radiodurans]|nr:hypothetical protein [Adhaeribacter radiodurans]
MYKNFRFRTVSSLSDFLGALARNQAGFNYPVGGCAPMRLSCCCG